MKVHEEKLKEHQSRREEKALLLKLKVNPRRVVKKTIEVEEEVEEEEMVEVEIFQKRMKMKKKDLEINLR